MNHPEVNANMCHAANAAMESELRELLALVEAHIDTEHVAAVDARYRQAFTFQEMDRPPLQVRPPYTIGRVPELPDPWGRFRTYSFAEALESPAAMMQNQILGFVVPGMLLRTDDPLAIRHACGTVLVASILGAKWRLHEGSNPWVEQFASQEELAAALECPVDFDNASVFARTVQTMSYFRRILDDYPACRKTIQISLPDTQGPFDTAEQVWGGDIYYAVADRSPLLDKLLAKIAEVTVETAQRLEKLTRDRLRPLARSDIDTYEPGNLMIRNDSPIMLSPEHYSEIVRPHDARMLKNVGGGSIHFCGNGEHLIPAMLDIPMMLGFDIGQSHLMDTKSIYQTCRSRQVVVSRMNPSREDLVSGIASRQFTTGAVFCYWAEDWDDAVDVVTQYYGRAPQA